MPKLKHDITNRLPPRQTYGRQGDEVTVISRHEAVLIVRGPTGPPYPILDDDLVDRLPDAVDPVYPRFEPVPEYRPTVPAETSDTESNVTPDLPVVPERERPVRKKRTKTSGGKGEDAQSALF